MYRDDNDWWGLVTVTVLNSPLYCIFSIVSMHGALFNPSSNFDLTKCMAWHRQLNSNPAITLKTVLPKFILCLRINVTKCLQRLHKNKCGIRRLHKVDMMHFEVLAQATLLPHARGKSAGSSPKVQFLAICRGNLSYGIVCCSVKKAV